MSFLITKNKEECCGCGNCINICPRNAISKRTDSEGFFFPEINKTLCVDCKLCEKVCPYSETSFHKISENHTFYACRNKNENTRNTSSSGGAFVSLATEILNSNGLVVGAAYTNSFSVEHIIIDSIEELEKLKHSKYVKSDLCDVFIKIKKILLNDFPVLFSGTPCQVDSLYSFLGKDYKSLYTCDIICHGTPSPFSFEKYLDFQKKRHQSEIVDINFKDKSVGWRQPNLKIDFKNGKNYLFFLYDDIYWKLYHSQLTTMNSCFSCKFASFNRPSDVTIGDFWGEKEHHFGNEDNRGTSIVIVNSLKGKDLFEKVKSEFIVIEISKEDATQPQLVQPANRPDLKKRKRFFKALNKNSFDKAFEISQTKTVGDKFDEFIFKVKYKLKQILKIN